MSPEGRRGIAQSDRYGSPSWFERMGIRVGRWVGDGWLRRALRSAFRRTLTWLTRGGPRSVLPNGEQVRLAPAYRFVTWNPVEYDAFRPCLAAGDTALDVGANVGAYAVLFGLWVGERGRVVALEPAPDAFAGLRAHVVLNGLERVVEPVRAAASDRAGEAEFVSEGVQGTNHLAPAGTDGAARIRVPTTTIDMLCAERGLGPRLIKIDVEGAELAVLRGARRTIAAMPPDGGLFVEMHPTTWATMGISAEDIRAELATQGLRAVPLRATDDPWAVDGECMRLERI